MFVLIGEGYELSQRLIGEPWERDDFEDQVALFESRSDAVAYAEASWLAAPQYSRWSNDKVFRNKSLLSRFGTYRIEEYEEECLPINPSL